MSDFRTSTSTSTSSRERARARIRHLHRAPESSVIEELTAGAAVSSQMRARISSRALQLVEAIRSDSNPGLMEVFLAEYGLSTEEGVALMCLAEALLRVPDAPTINELIEDKIAPSSWGEHLGSSSSSLVNASTWGLMLSGKILREPSNDGFAEVMQGVVKRLGEPVIRVAVQRAMKEMGHQFVLGETIEKSIARGRAMEDKGYTYSYDMLGEAAVTQADADTYFTAYSDAIRSLAGTCDSDSIVRNPGISIKLSALHPRYEMGQRERVLAELVPRVLELAILAKEANMGLNIDAEEADRLDLSLDVIESVVCSPKLFGWDGFGVVVQAYGKRAMPVIDWLVELATEIDRSLMIRLVKGAYWDTEVKIAQIDGVEEFPVFTKKAATDVSYICCAKKLLANSDRVYPQFATHNAHTVAAILEIAEEGQQFEFQRLHGMGESLHQTVLDSESTNCRIYAPVGAHQDLLAYLVRRLLENGANSSFVNQIVDKTVPAEDVVKDPFDLVSENRRYALELKGPKDLFKPERINSKGWDLRNLEDIERFENARTPYVSTVWSVRPLIADTAGSSIKLDHSSAIETFNPAEPSELVGSVVKATVNDVELALDSASAWSAAGARQRAAILNKAADLYEDNSGEIFAALIREAGKTPLDAVGEIREAVDFLRYYAAQASMLEGRGARGLITCISPWNFPLAIFTGQISAALAAGNGVLAKPADPTAIIATLGVKLLHKAGVPKNVLQLLPGSGSVVGAKLTSDARVSGVCFTGSTAVAQTINTVMAENMEPDAVLIAETGGLNAMIVDSTALPEQAIKDIVVSSFQSAGQRCSALRLLYLQEDVAQDFLTMLYGAIDELSVAKPWELSTDLGPVITQHAKQEIDAYINTADTENRLLKRITTELNGYFIGPSVISVNGIKDLQEEIFGPVLHVATFKAEQIDQIVSDINNSGYGLTFGLHTRIDDRVEQITSKLNVGNIYVNRNQIGAIVGSQPFGGEGLSGTGPKAGGPHYVPRFLQRNLPSHEVVRGNAVEPKLVQEALNNVAKPVRKALANHQLPGPTGESNRLAIFAKGTVLCLGPSIEDLQRQVEIAHEMGCSTVAVVPEAGISNGSIDGFLEREHLSGLIGFDAVALWSDQSDLRSARRALAQREGLLIPLLASDDMKDLCVLERHICIDTTAAGGNAALLAAQS